jgi:anaerobic selenocysteine-containing dehydrogenase
METEKTLKAFNGLEFIVVSDLFMTPTVMALADIVLPICTFAERNGIRCGDGTQRGETINKAVTPAGECKSDQEICLELGRRLNLEAWPWENVEEMFSSILADTGRDFYEVREEGRGDHTDHGLARCKH